MTDYLNEHETQEEIGYDATLIAMPDPGNPQILHPVILFLVAIANPIMGDPAITATAVMQNPFPPDGFVEETMRQMLEQLREARSKMLVPSTPPPTRVPYSPPNGHPSLQQ